MNIKEEKKLMIGVCVWGRNDSHSRDDVKKHSEETLKYLMWRKIYEFEIQILCDFSPVVTAAALCELPRASTSFCEW